MPLASLDAVLAHEASVSYKFDDHNAISLLARYRRDDYLGVADYLGTDLWSTTFLTGIDYAHDFGELQKPAADTADAKRQAGP